MNEETNVAVVEHNPLDGMRLSERHLRTSPRIRAQTRGPIPPIIASGISMHWCDLVRGKMLD